MNGRVARALRQLTRELQVRFKSDPKLNRDKYKVMKKLWVKTPWRERGKLLTRKPGEGF